MEAEIDPDSEHWDIPRSAQRRLFRALPLGHKLAIAADLADLVRAFRRPRLAPATADTRREGGAAGSFSEESWKIGPVFRRPVAGPPRHAPLRSVLLAWILATALTGSLPAASTDTDAKPTGAKPAATARVIKFVHLPEILEEQGPRPKNVWVYGRFTARTAVSDGVFLASVNEGINWPDWEEHFNLIDNPGNYVFRRVVFRTDAALPTIRKGTKFSIPKDHPARLVEIDQVDGTIARMVLESPPVIESQIGAGRLVKPQDPATKTRAADPPRRVVYFKQLGSIAKQEGSHPENLWIWGNFSARSNLRDGVVTATPAGVESRRVLEWIVGAALIYPIVEIPSRVIFYVHQPRTIRNGDRIEVTPKHPARVRRLFETGGILAWIDLDPLHSSAISVRMTSNARTKGVRSPAAPDPAVSAPGARSEATTPVSDPTGSLSPERTAMPTP